MSERVVLIIGGGDPVWLDLSALEKLVPDAGWTDYTLEKPCLAAGRITHRIPLAWPGPVIAVNDMTCHFPGRIDHAASIHANKFLKPDPNGHGEWRAKRAANGFNTDYLTWGQPDKAKYVDRTLTQWVVNGSSGMYAAAVARDGLKCTKAILCGVGMTPTGHFVGSEEHDYGKRWLSASKHWKQWQLPRIKSRCEGWLRSMSGNTRWLLGFPSKSWIHGKPAKRAA